MLRKRRGEIATLLTLGLVILGGVLAIGSSVFLSKQKTTNTKAAEGISCDNSNDYNCDGVTAPCSDGTACGETSVNTSNGSCSRCMGPNCYRAQNPDGAVSYPAFDLVDPSQCSEDGGDEAMAEPDDSEAPAEAGAEEEALATSWPGPDEGCESAKGNYAWGPSTACYIVGGSNRGYCANKKIGDALTAQSAPCCAKMPNSNRFCCTTEMQTATAQFLRDNLDYKTTFSQKADTYGLSCKGAIISQAATLPASGPGSGSSPPGSDSDPAGLPTTDSPASGCEDYGSASICGNVSNGCKSEKGSSHSCLAGRSTNEKKWCCLSPSAQPGGLQCNVQPTNFICKTGTKIGMLVNYYKKSGSECGNESANKCYGLNNSSCDYGWTKLMEELCPEVKTTPTTVTTRFTTLVTDNSANLFGNVSDKTNLEYQFEWNKIGDVQVIKSGLKVVPNNGDFSQSVTGLEQNTTYQYKVCVYESDTKDLVKCGEYLEFTTTQISGEIPTIAPVSPDTESLGSCKAKGTLIEWQGCSYIESPAENVPCGNDNIIYNQQGCRLYRICSTNVCKYDCYKDGKKTGCGGADDPQTNYDIIRIINTGNRDIKYKNIQITLYFLFKDFSSSIKLLSPSDIGDGADIIKPGETVSIDLNLIGFSCNALDWRSISTEFFYYKEDGSNGMLRGDDGCGDGVKIMIYVN